jgi:hypothetical protein
MKDLHVISHDRIGKVDGPWKMDQLERTERSPFDKIEGRMDILCLDVSVFITQESRSELPILTDETRKTLQEANWPDTVINDLTSEAEAKIYLDAGLEPRDDVNGKPALVRTDIDPDQKDRIGQTNLERMQSGRAPLDKEGKPIELHHIGQKQDSCLAELTGREHIGNGNDNILHNKTKESEINRDGFSKERAEHWKARAEDFEKRI